MCKSLIFNGTVFTENYHSLFKSYSKYEQVDVISAICIFLFLESYGYMSFYICSLIIEIHQYELMNYYEDNWLLIGKIGLYPEGYLFHDASFNKLSARKKVFDAIITHRMCFSYV